MFASLNDMVLSQACTSIPTALTLFIRAFIHTQFLQPRAPPIPVVAGGGGYGHRWMVVEAKAKFWYRSWASSPAGSCT